MDREILKFLAAGGNLSMPHRIVKGLWPHAPIPKDELRAAIVEAIEENGWSPRRWRPSAPGEPVWGGGGIEKQAEHYFLYRAQGWRIE